MCIFTFCLIYRQLLTSSLSQSTTGPVGCSSVAKLYKPPTCYAYDDSELLIKLLRLNSRLYVSFSQYLLVQTTSTILSLYFSCPKPEWYCSIFKYSVLVSSITVRLKCERKKQFVVSVPWSLTNMLRIIIFFSPTGFWTLSCYIYQFSPPQHMECWNHWLFTAMVSAHETNKERTCCTV